MTLQEIRALFDQALQLSPGESIHIPCDDHKEQNYIRISLYRERTAYDKRNPDTRSNLQISRTSEEGLPTVTISKPRLGKEKAIFKRAAAGIELLTLSHLLPREKTTQEDQRIRNLMQADGYSEEEITTILSASQEEEEEEKGEME
jgi:hypothetical protein